MSAESFEAFRGNSIRSRFKAAIVRSADGARIAGEIQDVVFTAGTVRYRVTTPGGAQLTVKLPSQRQVADLEVGQPVTLTCTTSDTLLIPKE